MNEQTDMLKDALKKDFGVELSSEFVKHAGYYHNIDCIEYLSKDVFAIADRIDSFLTVLWNEDFTALVGFKLKGFRAAYNQLSALEEITNTEFNVLVKSLEHYFTKFGNEMFPEKRQEAYRNVISFIESEHVGLADDEVQELKAA
jgi:hypothetical protein